MRKYLLFLLFILTITSVNAFFMEDNIPPFIAVNETFKVEVTGDLNSSNNLIFTLNESTNMTYDSDNNLYYLYILSDVEETLIYNITDQTNETKLTGVLNFRIPYNITLNLYNENVSGLGLTSNYCNELSTVFLVSESDKSEFEDLESYTSLFNKFMNSIPFFGDYTNLNTNFVSKNVVFYTSPYTDCSSTITLYEPGNYSVFLIGSKYIITGEDYGFDNPLNKEDQFISNIVDLEFTNKEDLTISIFTNDWEISKIWVLLNIGKWLLITVLPVVLIFLIKSGVLGALMVRLVQK